MADEDSRPKLYKGMVHRPSRWPSSPMPRARNLQGILLYTLHFLTTFYNALRLLTQRREVMANMVEPLQPLFDYFWAKGILQLNKARPFITNGLS